MAADRRQPDRRQTEGGVPDGLILGILGFLLGMTIMVWTATGVAGLLAHGRWPAAVHFTRTPLAMRHLIGRPHDIPGAWPESPPLELPGSGLFWGIFIGQLMILFVLTVFLIGVLTRYRVVRARRRAARSGTTDGSVPLEKDPSPVPRPRDADLRRPSNGGRKASAAPADNGTHPAAPQGYHTPPQPGATTPSHPGAPVPVGYGAQPPPGAQMAPQGHDAAGQPVLPAAPVGYGALGVGGAPAAPPGAGAPAPGAPVGVNSPGPSGYAVRPVPGFPSPGGYGEHGIPGAHLAPPGAGVYSAPSGAGAPAYANSPAPGGYGAQPPFAGGPAGPGAAGGEQPAAGDPLAGAELSRTYALFAASRGDKAKRAVEPAILNATGPVIVTTADAETYHRTVGNRSKLGPVAVFDPAHLIDIPGRLRWAPHTGCEDSAKAATRAAALLAPLRPTSSLDSMTFAAAETLLRCWLHAAGVDGLPFRQVHRWAAGGAAGGEAVRILRTARTAAPGWSGELESILHAHPERRDAAQALIHRGLECLNSIHIRDACNPGRVGALDLESFVAERGSLYVVGEAIEDPRARPGAMPLLTALVSSVVEHGRSMAARSSAGRLDPPMTLVLDDIAALAPIPELPELLATGRIAGLPVLAVFRSPEQARDRWRSAVWQQADVRLSLGDTAGVIADEIPDSVRLG
ncbi:TraM recognition domain-containing protein [Streptomyces sp. H10-C2]|uniref:TraM recognition domain-containing protein n=1 Tax=unclassified Streptomyces TaxID=2593676 RepID=UPI0024B87CEC|nr:MULTISPECIES: TraM recognition domain-containing protein [unclassified Streptomyces]MDJ0345121.1 TraM recognition domain-containing protein [Streptomyces sp. PH10-H1]MDJ0374026.1 TraM recognition domain-containing protein [Streptomyces sp. H10-C2]